MNSIATEPKISKVRPNLFELDTGEVIGFGQRLAPGGLGFCFTCGCADCQHVKTVFEDWLAGRHSVLEGYEVPANSGYHAEPTVAAPSFTLIEPTQADIDAVNNGSQPGAWRPRCAEEVPSGLARTL